MGLGHGYDCMSNGRGDDRCLDHGHDDHSSNHCHASRSCNGHRGLAGHSHGDGCILVSPGCGMCHGGADHNHSQSQNWSCSVESQGQVGDCVGRKCAQSQIHGVLRLSADTVKDNRIGF